jgi:diguanylate cyclase (GGDEF)-like protein
LGGDEFVVVLTEPADQHLADVIASRFAGEIARSHGVIQELAITASVGAAQSIDGLTAEEILGCADTAMYRAKSQGGNSAVHYLETHPD